MLKFKKPHVATAPHSIQLPTKQPLHKRFMHSFLMAFVALFVGSIINSLYPSVQELMQKASATQPHRVSNAASSSQAIDVPSTPENYLLQAVARKESSTLIVNKPTKPKQLEKLSNRDRKELNRLLDRIKGR